MSSSMHDRPRLVKQPLIQHKLGEGGAHKLLVVLNVQPKVPGHTAQCSASAFSCIDCGRTFDQYSVKVRPASAPTAAMHACCTSELRIHS